MCNLPIEKEEEEEEEGFNIFKLPDLWENVEIIFRQILNSDVGDLGGSYFAIYFVQKNLELVQPLWSTINE